MSEYERKHKPINRFMNSGTVRPETAERLVLTGMNLEGFKRANQRKHWLALERVHKRRKEFGITSLNGLTSRKAEKLFRAHWRTIKQAFSLTLEHIQAEIRKLFDGLVTTLNELRKTLVRTGSGSVLNNSRSIASPLDNIDESTQESDELAPINQECLTPGASRLVAKARESDGTEKAKTAASPSHTQPSTRVKHRLGATECTCGLNGCLPSSSELGPLHLNPREFISNGSSSVSSGTVDTELGAPVTRREQMEIAREERILRRFGKNREIATKSKESAAKEVRSVKKLSIADEYSIAFQKKCEEENREELEKEWLARGDQCIKAYESEMEAFRNRRQNPAAWENSRRNINFRIKLKVAKVKGITLDYGRRIRRAAVPMLFKLEECTADIKAEYKALMSRLDMRKTQIQREPDKPDTPVSRLSRYSLDYCKEKS